MTCFRLIYLGVSLLHYSTKWEFCDVIIFFLHNWISEIAIFAPALSSDTIVKICSKDKIINRLLKTKQTNKNPTKNEKAKEPQQPLTWKLILYFRTRAEQRGGNRWFNLGVSISIWLSQLICHSTCFLNLQLTVAETLLSKLNKIVHQAGP